MENKRRVILEQEGWLNIKHTLNPVWGRTMREAEYLVQGVQQFEVEFLYRSQDNFCWKKSTCKDLESLIDECFEEFTIWLSFSNPDRFRELIHRYNIYVDKQKDGR